jgi:hypothetical protein
VARGIFAGELNTPQKVWKEYLPLVPRDQEFQEDFARWIETKPARARYVLAELEKAEFRTSHGGADPEEIPPWEELTLEHVLPTNPVNEWSEEIKADPELREEFMNRLGNLCLLPGKVNKESSAKSFKFKSKGIYAKSQLTLTSQITQKYEQWNRQSIQTRQQGLAQLALLAWPLPSSS